MQQLLYVPLAGLVACAGAPKPPPGDSAVEVTEPEVDGRLGACAILDARTPGLVIVNYGARPRSDVRPTATSALSRRARLQRGLGRRPLDVEFVTSPDQAGLRIAATTTADMGTERHHFRMTGGAIHHVDAQPPGKAAPLEHAVRGLLGLGRTDMSVALPVQQLLPEEAVGRGSQWVFTGSYGEQGGTVTEFELVGYADGVATVRTRRHTCGRRIHGPPQGHPYCDEPSVPPGIDCFDGLEIGETVSTGTLTIDTTGIPFPTGTVTTRGKEIYNTFGTRSTLDIDDTVTLEWL